MFTLIFLRLNCYFLFFIFQNNYEKKANEKRTVRFKTPIEESLDLDNSEDNMKFLGPIK